MLDFHEKRKLKSYLYSKPMVAGLFVVSALFSVTVFHRFESEREIAEKEHATARELGELQQQAAALEAQVTHLKSDRGVEGEIRDRFEVSKKGEQVVVLVGDEKQKEEAKEKTASTTPTQAPEAPKGHFWSSWW